LVQILTEPKNALTKQYSRLFDIENVKLTFKDDALDAIAKKAIERKTGARGLRTIIENLLLNTMYEVPDLDDVTEVVITADVVNKDDVEPVLVRGDKKKKKTAKKENKSDDDKGKSKKEAS
jgi:ATP-dependent Clp protease ATP-binding subunit ClpX